MDVNGDKATAPRLAIANARVVGPGGRGHLGGCDGHRLVNQPALAARPDSQVGRLRRTCRAVCARRCSCCCRGARRRVAGCGRVGGDADALTRLLHRDLFGEHAERDIFSLVEHRARAHLAIKLPQTLQQILPALKVIAYKGEATLIN